MRFLIFLLSLVHFVPTFAQSEKHYLTKRIDNTLKIDFAQDLSPEQFFNHLALPFGLTDKDKMKLISTKTGKNNFKHYKYQQYHNGIEVFGASYHIHTSEDKIVSTNGDYLPEIDLNTTPKITTDQAIQFAKEIMGAEEYAATHFHGTALAHDDHETKAILKIIDSAIPKKSTDYHLVYQVDLHATKPLDQQRYFISAQTGHLIKQFSLHHHQNVPSKGITTYYGEKEFRVDSIAPNNFVLQDDSRGNGIITYQDTGSPSLITSDENYFDFTDQINGESAIDAHYGASRFYDLLIDNFNWNGIDNNGKALQSVVHIGNGIDYVNAYWDGQYAWFGDGDCRYNPLTSLDVVGHEFTHGITQSTANLIYADESGALNESMSDIFGKALEYYEDNENFDWLIGGRFVAHPNIDAFRSMEDPTVDGNPKHYKGTHWEDGADVHYNSGVLNHWFYLLVEGKVDTTEFGVQYNVPSIGMEKAMQIAFLTLTQYMIETTNYPEAYDLTILATQELYGINSPEEAAVKEAWKAVGLPYQQSNLDELDLGITALGRFESTCLFEDYYELKIGITNNSNELLPAGTEIPIIVDNDTDNPTSVILEEDLAFTGYQEFVIDDVYYVTEEGFDVVSVRIDLEDANANNNSASAIFNNFSGPEQDFRVAILRHTNNACFQEQIDISVFVENSSCNTIPPGSNYTLRLEHDGEILDQAEVSLVDSLISGRRNASLFSIPFDINIDSINVILTSENDIDPSNNELTLAIEALQSLDINYSNLFNDPSSIIPPEVAIDRDYYTALVDYDDETYLGATSFSSSSRVLCEDLFRNFNDDRFPSMSMCVDFSDYEFPVMKFDLVQFRNTIELNFPEEVPYYAMTYVEWENEESSSFDIIYGQEEGSIVNHIYQLPPNFKGMIKFKFYSFKGRQANLALNDFDEYDFNLLDNLNFYNQNLTSVEQVPNYDFAVIPNPAHDEITLDIDHEDFGTLTIYDNLGMLVYSGMATGQEPIQISEMSAGIYFVKFESTKKKKIYSSRLIKI